MALLQNNNPIEAFLNCIIASVEKETVPPNAGGEEEEIAANTMDSDNKKDDDDNDVEMNE